MKGVGLADLDREINKKLPQITAKEFMMIERGV